MSYAIVKNGVISCISDAVPVKSVPGVYKMQENEETGEMERVCLVDPIPGIDYDEAIEIDAYDYRKEYTFKDGEIEVCDKPEYMEPCQEEKEQAEIITKAKRINAIEAEIRALGSVETTSTFLQTVNETRIGQLRAEKAGLETALDDEAENMEPGVFDTIISAIFR